MESSEIPDNPAPKSEEIAKALEQFFAKNTPNATPEEFQEVIKKGMDKMMAEFEVNPEKEKPKKKHTKHPTRASKMAQLRK